MRGAVVPLCGVCSSVPQPIIFSRAFRQVLFDLHLRLLPLDTSKRIDFFHRLTRIGGKEKNRERSNHHRPQYVLFKLAPRCQKNCPQNQSFPTSWRKHRQVHFGGKFKLRHPRYSWFNSLIRELALSFCSSCSHFTKKG